MDIHNTCIYLQKSKWSLSANRRILWCDLAFFAAQLYELLEAAAAPATETMMLDRMLIAQHAMPITIAAIANFLARAESCSALAMLPCLTASLESEALMVAIMPRMQQKKMETMEMIMLSCTWAPLCIVWDWGATTTTEVLLAWPGWGAYP